MGFVYICLILEIKKSKFTYSTSNNETPPISRVLKKLCFQLSHKHPRNKNAFLLNTGCPTMLSYAKKL